METPRDSEDAKTTAAGDESLEHESHLAETGGQSIESEATAPESHRSEATGPEEKGASQESDRATLQTTTQSNTNTNTNTEMETEAETETEAHTGTNTHTHTDGTDESGSDQVLFHRVQPRPEESETDVASSTDMPVMSMSQPIVSTHQGIRDVASEVEASDHDHDHGQDQEYENADGYENDNDNQSQNENGNVQIVESGGIVMKFADHYRVPRQPGLVRVRIDDPTTAFPRFIDVHIVLDLQRKPFLGGFRNKKTGAEYVNASTQTPRVVDPSRVKVHKEKFHRECQTVKVATRSQFTTRESGTQMKKSGVYVDESNDRHFMPKAYFTSEQLLSLKEENAITIQRYVRGWFARKKAKILRDELDEKRQVVREQERKRKEEIETKRRRDIERRMHPRTAEDFHLLYSELEAWRLQETKKINESNLSKEERHKALERLLLKETKLLQTIDRLKIAAMKNNKDSRVSQSLEMMAAPKKWAMSDGEVAEVHTPFTIRAKELMDLYNGLKLPLLTIDERLDVLLHVKWTVKEFDCNLTRELVELIDREADLLNRGRSEKSLEGLRRRIGNLFLQFIETPEFNPEAARFQKVPYNFTHPSFQNTTATLS